MADLLAAARTATTLARFVEEDLVGLMIRLDIDAAGIALSGLSEARDTRAVCWSAINHLEAGQAKLQSQLRTTNAFESAQAYLYVAAIKALILKHLKEDRLVAKCLADSLVVVEKQNRWDGSFWHEMKKIVDVLNPGAWIMLFRNSDLQKAARSFRPAKFWEALGYPGPHELILEHTVQVSRMQFETRFWPSD